MRLEPAIHSALQPPIGLAINKGGLPAWSPRALFAAGEQGAWYDPSDLSTLFQDSAGTTPVTAVGQPVGLVKDKSGRGNHASQATATARPTLQQDSGGRYYLSFDGTDDSMATAAINFSATSKATVWAGVRKESEGATGIICELTASQSNPGAFSVITSSGGLPNYAFVLDGSAEAGYRATTFTAPVTNVLSCGFDIAGAALASEVMPRVNGLVPTLTSYLTATAGAGSLANAALYIGRRGGSSVPFSGRLYGLIVRGAASTAAQIASGERYLAARSGVTL